jgi:hypothetical protein
MADCPPSDGSSIPDAVSAKDVTVQISYCPTLGLYHYKRIDGEYFFDGEQLEVGIEVYLRDGKKTDAEFMSKLTSWARIFPHKLVTFFSDKTFEIREPVVSKLEEDEEMPGEPGLGTS